LSSYNKSRSSASRETDVEDGPEFGFKPGSTDQYSDWHKREHAKIGDGKVPSKGGMLPKTIP